MKNFRDFYQVVSCFFFSLLGYQVKLELSHNTIENIVFFRSFLGAIILVFVCRIKGENFIKNRKTSDYFVHLLRASFGVLAMYFGYNALNYITLAQASTLSFTKVFFSTILAYFIFKEKLTLGKTILVLVGFFGVLFISEPGTFDNSKGFYMAIFSALCVSGGVISIAYLSKREKTNIILLYHSLISTIIFFSIFHEEISLLNLSNFISYLLLTTTALIGQYFNTESYKNDLTNNVMILSYSRIIFSTTLGFFLLDEVIDLYDFIGIFIIILTTLIIKRKDI